MSLESLPNEILAQIIRCFHDEIVYRGDIRSVALCSKRLNALANPSLFQEFTSSDWKRSQAFGRALLRNPELGKYTKRLTVNSIATVGESPKQFKIDDKDVVRCRALMNALGYSTREVEKWCSDLKSGDWDALQTLLLLSVPSVEHFWMYSSMDNFCRLSKLLPIFQKVAQHQVEGEGSPPLLNRLSSVTVVVAKGVATTLEDILPLLKLKSVTNMGLHYIKDDVGISSDIANLTTTELRLHSTSLSKEALASLLFCYKNLSSLKWSEYDIGTREILSANYFARSISHLRHSLRRLEVTTDESAIGSYLPYHESALAVGYLAEFKKLTVLKIPARLLFTGVSRKRPQLVDILPNCLEEFELVNYDAPILKQVVDLVDQREQLVPKLRHIRLNEPICHTEAAFLAWKHDWVDLTAKIMTSTIQLQGDMAFWDTYPEERLP